MRERRDYFRAYYLAHREAILAKNRRWIDAHRARVNELARRRYREEPPPDVRCVDCGAPTVRAVRCVRCRLRYRYATDPAYRARRLAAANRYQARRRAAAADALD